MMRQEPFSASRIFKADDSFFQFFIEKQIDLFRPECLKIVARLKADACEYTPVRISRDMQQIYIPKNILFTFTVFK